jgi:hypothetical protein
MQSACMRACCPSCDEASQTDRAGRASQPRSDCSAPLRSRPLLVTHHTCSWTAPCGEPGSETCRPSRAESCSNSTHKQTDACPTVNSPVRLSAVPLSSIALPSPASAPTVSADHCEHRVDDMATSEWSECSAVGQLWLSGLNGTRISSDGVRVVSQHNHRAAHIRMDDLIPTLSGVVV